MRAWRAWRPTTTFRYIPWTSEKPNSKQEQQSHLPWSRGTLRPCDTLPLSPAQPSDQSHLAKLALNSLSAEDAGKSVWPGFLRGCPLRRVGQPRCTARHCCSWGVWFWLHVPGVSGSTLGGLSPGPTSHYRHH